MLCYVVQCCTVLCCAVLCCVGLGELCCAVLCCAMLHCVVLCCVVLCCVVLRCAVLCCGIDTDVLWWPSSLYLLVELLNRLHVIFQSGVKVFNCLSFTENFCVVSIAVE